MIEIKPKDDNTQRLQSAIDGGHASGGSHVKLLPGTHFVGTIQLRSNTTLDLAPGAVLKGIPEAHRYRYFQGSVASRMDVVPWRAMLFADSAENVRITGSGTIDGSGDAPCFDFGNDNDPRRPYGMHFINCKNVRVEGLSLTNSAFWMQRYFNCECVFIRGLNVYNHANQNNDGIDIDSSRDVIVSDCLFDTSDDAICIKSEGEAPSRDITIQNCILATHASGLKLGTGSVGGFEYIVVSNIVMRRSKSKKMMHPLGFWEGITGIDISSMDGGPLRNVLISNIVMEGFSCPVLLKLGNRLSGTITRQGYEGDGDEKQGVQGGYLGNSVTEARCFEDLSITNLQVRETGPYPIIATAYSGARLKRIRFRDVQIQHRIAAATDEAKLPSQFKDNAYPGPWSYDSKFPCHGLFTRGIEALTIENFRSLPAKGDTRPERYDCNPES